MNENQINNNEEQMSKVATLVCIVTLAIGIFIIFIPYIWSQRITENKQANTIIGEYYLDKLQNSCENLNISFTINSLTNMTELEAIKEIKNCEQIKKNKDLEIVIKRVNEKLVKIDK